MTHRVGAKGQVVLPKPVRDRLGIRPGDRVTVDAVNGEARVRRVESGEPLLGMLAGGESLTAELEAEHRGELERDDSGRPR